MLRTNPTFTLDCITLTKISLISHQGLISQISFLKMQLAPPHQLRERKLPPSIPIWLLPISHRTPCSPDRTKHFYIHPFQTLGPFKINVSISKFHFRCLNEFKVNIKVLRCNFKFPRMSTLSG